MNILQLISSTGFFGAESVVMRLARELASLGHYVFVGVIAGRKAQLQWPSDGDGKVPVEFFPCRGRLDRHTLARIRDSAAEKYISVLNSHNYKSDFYGYLACRGRGVRLVATCHNWLAHNRKMKVYERMDKFILRGFDAVVAVSPALRQEIVESGVAGQRAKLIFNGVAVPEQAKNGTRVREELGIRDNERLIVSVGRLSREKGHQILLQAFSCLLRWQPQLRLLLIGDGPERARLESEARALDIRDKVTFTGFRRDIPAFLSAGELFVLPSLTEGMPLALLEAMASARPCVATRVGAVTELLGRDEYGLAVAPGDPRPLALAMLKLLGEPALAKRLAEAARERVARDFSSAKMAAEYERLYRDG